MGTDLGKVEVGAIVGIDHELDLPGAAMRVRPSAQGQPGHAFSNHLAQLVCVFHASWDTVEPIASQDDQGSKPERIGFLGKFEAIVERVLGSEDRNDQGMVGFGIQVDDHVPKVLFFTTPGRPVRHEDEALERSNFPDEVVAVDPGVHALIERQIHLWRTPLNVQQRLLRVVYCSEQGHP